MGALGRTGNFKTAGTLTARLVELPAGELKEKAQKTMKVSQVLGDSEVSLFKGSFV